MELKITRRVDVTETINISFPYYYKHDLLPDDGNSALYGKIEEQKCTVIRVSEYYSRGSEFEIEISNRSASAFGCYMGDEYKSTEAEYLAAKEKMLKAARDA